MLPGGRNSTLVLASALACFSARFALRDLPDFLDMCCRGDLSAMVSSLVEADCFLALEATPGDLPTPSAYQPRVRLVGKAQPTTGVEAERGLWVGVLMGVRRRRR